MTLSLETQNYRTLTEAPAFAELVPTSARASLSDNADLTEPR